MIVLRISTLVSLAGFSAELLRMMSLALIIVALDGFLSIFFVVVRLFDAECAFATT